MSIVPLSEWYPSMHRTWLTDSNARRIPVLIGDRKGYTIHHTLGGGGQGSLSYARSVAHYHYWIKEWYRPGGYGFLIGTDGVIREMCGWGFVGAHAPGCNRSSIGVAFQGTFTRTLPNAKQLAAFSTLVADGPVPNRQQGHRDCTAGRTCPGDALYRALPLDVTEPEPDEDDDMTPEQDELLRHIHSHTTDSQREGSLRNRTTETLGHVRVIRKDVRKLIAGAAVGGASAGAIVTEIANRLAG